ncbi:hypothetical protein AB0C86_04450 [Streptomyces lavendulae]
MGAGPAVLAPWPPTETDRDALDTLDYAGVCDLRRADDRCPPVLPPPG